MKIFLLVLWFVVASKGQSTNEFSIAPKSSTVVGNFNLLDLTGNKITLKAPTSVTAYSLTWPASVTAGCLTTSGAGVLSWASCVSLPIDDSLTLIKGSADATKLFRFEVDGLTTGTTRIATVPDYNFTLAAKDVNNFFATTQTMRSIEFVAADAYSIGATNEAQLVRSKTFDGVTSASPGANWMRTRKLEAWDQGGSSGFWYLQATASAGGTSNFALRDTAGNVAQFWNLSTFGVIDPYSYLVGDWLPDVTGRKLGRVGQSWDAQLRNVTITGVCTGCGSGISNLNGLTTSPQFFAFGSTGFSPNISSSGSTHTFNIPFAGSGISAGLISNGTQTLAGDKYLQGSILPSSGSTYSNGNSSFPWLYVTTRNLEVTDGFGSNWRFNSSSNYMQLTSPGGSSFMSWDASLGRVFVGTNLLPFGTGVYDLGSSSFPWRTGFINSLTTSSFGSSTIYIGSGNFYNRSFAGSPSCAGVADGWQGVDTLNNRMWVCVSGAARWVFLNP